ARGCPAHRGGGTRRVPRGRARGGQPGRDRPADRGQLARQPGEEQFVTAILAEVSADSAKLELLSCGHPPPLLLGTAPPRLADLGPGSLPLGLGHLTGEPRIPVTIPFGAGDQGLSTPTG
ncbi:MAG: SpoIIE family protein phosphatase, partial [Streptosporangiaceae bacterium]